jgi:hypothetical protein
VDEMNCDELVERVTDHLEDALGTEDQLRWDDHVGVCFGCQAHVREIRVTLDLVSSLGAEPPSAQLESTLLARYREWAESVGP